MTKFGDPFNPKTGEFADNIRSIVDDGNDAELRSSLQQFGWIAEFPALVDEHDVCLVGHRRLKLAKELKIDPVIKRLSIGSGDAADAERLKLAIASNVGFKPMTKDDRKHIAEYLYGKREWTMERIGEALGVGQGTISKDLGNSFQGNKLKPAKTTSNPKGAGRPKGTRLKAEPVKFGRDVREKVATLVLDEGKTFKEAEAETGVSNIVARTAVAHEQGRRRAQADPPIDPDTLSFSARQKFDAAIRQHKRKLELEFEPRVQQRLQDLLGDTVLPAYNKSYVEYQEVTKTRKGLMDKATFNKIRRCLHPDSRQSVSDDRLHDAFQLFSKMELLLLDESQYPTATFNMPRTYEELMALKRKVQEARRAKRNQSNGIATRQ